MLKKQRAEYIHLKLNQIYPSIPIPLVHKDVYSLLVAVLLSAQCTDSRVNQVTPVLFEIADNPKDMSKIPIQTIYEIIRPCGLAPKKSRAIHELSNILVNKFHCEVPECMELLETLPGVGHKTASVVMSQAFGIPAFPVDTHIHRMLYRWGMTNGISIQQTEKDAKRLFPMNIWSKLHLQIIYYAREFSPSRGWNINNDFITKKIGRKSILNKIG